MPPFDEGLSVVAPRGRKCRPQMRRRPAGHCADRKYAEIIASATLAEQMAAGNMGPGRRAEIRPPLPDNGIRPRPFLRPSLASGDPPRRHPAAPNHELHEHYVLRMSRQVRSSTKLVGRPGATTAPQTSSAGRVVVHHLIALRLR